MRQTRGTIPLYSSVFPTRIIRRLSYREALSLVESGTVYGCYRGRGKERELCAAKMTGPLQAANNSPSGITASESVMNAGSRFERGASRTASMQESEKLSLEKLAKPAEDMIERVTGKVRFYPLLGCGKAVRVVHPSAFRTAKVLAESEA